MKVYIGPYTNWIGPYQIAEALCFWVKKETDEFGTPKTPDWVHNFGSWLAHGTTDGKIIDRKNAPQTWLYKLCNWIESKKKRRVYVKIDKYDTWSMDHTLAYIVLPMLKQLKQTTHGAPNVDDEDVPDELKSTSAPPKENEYDTDANHFKRWDWILDEMIHAFECKVDDSWENQYRKGEADYITEPCEWDENGKPKMYEMKPGPEHTYECDYDGLRKHEERIRNGFRLFGKYYQNLWD